MQSSGQIITTNIQFFTGRMPFLSPNQQCQSTEGKRALLSCSIVFHFTVFFILFFVLWWYKQNDDDDDDDDQYAPNFHCMDMCYTKRECLTIYSVLFRVK